MNLSRLRWQRDPANPVLPPDPNATCESTRCMNPFVVRVDSEYRLYYSGGDAEGNQHLCLATASVETPSRWP